MSTFYAALPDSVKAQQMVRHLMDDGIALDDISLVNTRSPEAEYESSEMSPIGGGISTANTETDVADAGEMEESQEASETEFTPLNDVSNGDHELDELNLTLRTGFPTSASPINDPIEET